MEMCCLTVLEARNPSQGVGRTTPHLKPAGEDHPAPPASGGLQEIPGALGLQAHRSTSALIVTWPPPCVPMSSVSSPLHKVTSHTGSQAHLPWCDPS